MDQSLIHWHSGNIPEGSGVYDFKTKGSPDDTYQVSGFSKPFSRSEFGNYLVGYSTGFATIMTGGDPHFAVGLGIAGSVYNAVDLVDNGNGHSISFIGIVTGWVNRLEGWVSGEVDAVGQFFGLDE